MPNTTRLRTQQLADAIVATARSLAKTQSVEDSFDAVKLRAFENLTARVIGPGHIEVGYPGVLTTTVITWRSIVQSVATAAIDLTTDIGTEWHAEAEDGHIFDVDGEPAVTFTW